MTTTLTASPRCTHPSPWPLPAPPSPPQLAISTDGRTPQYEILVSHARDHDTDTTAHTAELAYAIGSRHRGQRLATCAVQLITELRLHQLHFTTVLRIAAANPASTAVARADGYHITPEPPLTLDSARDPLLTWQHQSHRTKIEDTRASAPSPRGLPLIPNDFPRCLVMGLGGWRPWVTSSLIPGPGVPSAGSAAERY
ncbi:GNAT family N-acetyltransferase [Actinomadura coerulea]|uniref:GNAT family N-acetyltransferase n=1 Tax=Actinomadura coerulea TaxID=46159 RepID=UPI00343EBA8B